MGEFIIAFLTIIFSRTQSFCRASINNLLIDYEVGINDFEINQKQFKIP